MGEIKFIGKMKKHGCEGGGHVLVKDAKCLEFKKQIEKVFYVCVCVCCL